MGSFVREKEQLLTTVDPGLFKPELRIPDVYPGSEFFHPGSRIRFRTPEPNPLQRIVVLLTQKIVSKLSEI
jgi:hypothetical protein